MEVPRQSSDIISTLPEDIIDNILTRMPIRDALRTSILSRRWRYCWTSMPKVTFDQETFFKDKKMKKHKLVYAVFHVLLLHKGPISEFHLYVGELDMASEFDPIILHLSRSNHVKKLTFVTLTNPYWKLPSLFFTLQGLEYLEITNCVFEPPLTFKGFNRLAKVYLVDVEISAKLLLSFLSGCPLLEVVCLLETKKVVKGGNEFTLVDLLECLPLIVSFQICNNYLKYFSSGGTPQKLPTSLVRLRCLYLDVWLMEQCVFSSALCLIRSSLNLELIVFSIYGDEKWHDGQTSMNLFDLQNESSLSLDHLKEFRIEEFRNTPSEIEFMKLILAKSPVLKKLVIKLSCKVSVDDEVMMLRDMIYAPLQRASPSAKVIVTRQ